MKKVAILGSRGIPARYGGFEIFTERLGERLPDKGIELDIYCRKKLKKFAFSSKGVKRLFVPCPKFNFLEKLCLSNLAMLRAAFSRVDIVLLLGVSGVPFAFLAKMLGKKIILNPDGIEWKRTKWNFIGRFILRNLERIGVKISSAIVADSMAIGDYIKTQYKKDAVFIPYGTDSPEFTEKDWETLSEKYSLKAGDYYIVVGRDVPENNFSVIINGFLCSDTDKKLVIVSDLGDSYREHGKEKRVVFTGPIYKREKLFALRTNAFAYFHGHSVGGTNPSLLEALGCGNLAICHDNVFNREVCGDMGFYFYNSKDIPKIIIKIELLSLEERCELCDGLRERVRKSYNWGKVIDSYVKLFQNI